MTHLYLSWEIQPKLLFYFNMFLKKKKLYSWLVIKLSRYKKKKSDVHHSQRRVSQVPQGPFHRA